MSRGFKICMAKGVIESPRPSYGRSKLTLIVCIAEVGNFLFNQFHSHLLPNVFAFWQFSRILEIFRDSGKLPKCEVIWQKLAVELIKSWGSFYFSENLIFFLGLSCYVIMGFVSKNIFWLQIT